MKLDIKSKRGDVMFGIWGLDDIVEYVKKPKKEILKKYTKNAIEFLEKEATEKDFLVAYDFKPDEKVEEVVKELGYEITQTNCSICGKKLYMVNVKTKAKIVCMDCMLSIMAMASCEGGDNIAI